MVGAYKITGTMGIGVQEGENEYGAEGRTPLKLSRDKDCILARTRKEMLRLLSKALAIGRKHSRRMGEKPHGRKF